MPYGHAAQMFVLELCSTCLCEDYVTCYAAADLLLTAQCRRTSTSVFAILPPLQFLSGVHIVVVQAKNSFNVRCHEGDGAKWYFLLFLLRLGMFRRNYYDQCRVTSPIEADRNIENTTIQKKWRNIEGYPI